MAETAEAAVQPPSKFKPLILEPTKESYKNKPAKKRGEKGEPSQPQPLSLEEVEKRIQEGKLPRFVQPPVSGGVQEATHAKIQPEPGLKELTPEELKGLSITDWYEKIKNIPPRRFQGELEFQEALAKKTASDIYIAIKQNTDLNLPTQDLIKPKVMFNLGNIAVPAGEGDKVTPEFIAQRLDFLIKNIGGEGGEKLPVQFREDFERNIAAVKKLYCNTYNISLVEVARAMKEPSEQKFPEAQKASKGPTTSVSPPKASKKPEWMERIRNVTDVDSKPSPSKIEENAAPVPKPPKERPAPATAK